MHRWSKKSDEVDCRCEVECPQTSGGSVGSSVIQKIILNRRAKRRTPGHEDVCCAEEVFCHIVFVGPLPNSLTITNHKLLF